MVIPIICETPHCPNNGECINRISGIEPQFIQAFFEDWRGEPEDYCPLCGELGIAYDPKDKED